MPEKSLPRSNISTRSARANISAFAIRPLIPAEWAAFEDLFGPDRGASSGCWCMWTRMPRPQWKAMPRDDRKAAFRAIVESGPAPGLLAFDGDKAVAWCAIAPRADTAKYDGAKVSQLPDELRDEPAPFSITCFYIRAGYRNRGLMGLLAEAADRPCEVARRIERRRVRHRDGSQAHVGRGLRRHRLGVPQARLRGDRPPHAHASADAAVVLTRLSTPATARAWRVPARGRRDP